MMRQLANALATMDLLDALVTAVIFTIRAGPLWHPQDAILAGLTRPLFLSALHLEVHLKS